MPADHHPAEGRPASVVIVGGGITGLAAAWYLERAAERSGRALSVTLIEREAALGGKIGTLREDGFVVESGPDGFLTRKPWALELAQSLGIADEVTPMQATGAALLRGGRLHPIPPGLMGPAPASRRDVWGASFLSWPGKVRASMEPFVGARKGAERESLGGFLRRRMGAEITDALLEPLTAGIYGSDSYAMSLDALFPMLPAWEQRYGSIMRGMREARKAAPAEGQPKSAFFSFTGGAHRLVQAIAERLTHTEIVSGRSADAIDAADGATARRYRVTLDDARTFDAGAIVLATPAQGAAGLVGSLSPELSRALGRMRSAPAVSVHLAFRRENVAHPLDGSGFLSPRSEPGPVAGCTWMSSKWSGRSPDDYVLLRAFLRSQGDALPDSSDAALADAACDALRPLLGIRGAPERFWVHRWESALPQYEVGHTEWLDAVAQRLDECPGVFLCGASYRGIGVPDCVRQGRDAAEQAFAFALDSVQQRAAHAVAV